jgi:hypothetical protein
MRQWHKFARSFWRYAFAWENYLLLARTLQAAWLVRQHLATSVNSPQLASAIAAVETLYLSPQPSWRISNAEKIARFAGFIVGVPQTWGRCVQRSLIVYRLLNAYGIPARLCFGINRQHEQLDGHAWVEKLAEPKRAFGEGRDPYEHYLTVYTSPLPAAK